MFDSFILQDGHSKLDIYCANKIPPRQMISSSNIIFLRFHSSYHGPGEHRGFKLEYHPYSKISCQRNL